MKMQKKYFPKIFSYNIFFYKLKEIYIQDGAELCQAQFKLGLAMLELLSTKLRSSSLC
jgi:hypothetical protein